MRAVGILNVLTDDDIIWTRAMKNEHNERMLSNVALRTHFTWSALLLAATFYPVMLVRLFASSSSPGVSVLHVAAGKTYSLLLVPQLLQIQSYCNTTHSIILNKSEPEQSIKEFDDTNAQITNEDMLE